MGLVAFKRLATVVASFVTLASAQEGEVYNTGCVRGLFWGIGANTGTEFVQYFKTSQQLMQDFWVL